MRWRTRVLSVVALGLLITCGAASVAAARWTRQRLPVPVSVDGQFVSVSCVSATFCIAAGSTSSAAAASPLIEAWDGTSWRVQATPNMTVPFATVDLTAVSCASAAACEAVGALELPGSPQGSTPIAEHWDGTSWSFQTVPNPGGAPGGHLTGVSCDAATDCMAVGTAGLAEHYDGVGWTAEPVLRGPGLASVSCSSPSACTAVGPNYANGTPTSVIERWDGSAWAAQTPPPGVLNSVSCPSDTTCTAVGMANNANEPPFVATWTSAGWTVANAPVPAGAFRSALTSVSCGSALGCVAVGEVATGVTGSGYAEVSAGGAWALSPLAPSGSVLSTIRAISCAASVCMAVGDAAGAPLAERWSGTGWTLERVGGPSTPDGVLVQGVACPTVGYCTAVGAIICADHCGVNRGVPVVYRQAGAAWRLQVLPEPKGALNGLLLHAVSCPRRAFCMAVGQAETLQNQEGAPLAERLSHGAWTVVPTPGARGADLDSVSCPSPRFCMAVGVAGPEGNALAERWDGTRWSMTRGAFGPGLNGVSCTSPRACTAVGSDILRWNGRRWSLQVGMQRVAGDLLSVSCPGRRACVAVGESSGLIGSAESPLTWAWNGRRWTRQAQARGAAVIVPTNGLTGVACASPASCIAVGDGPGSGISATNLAEHWNGSRWSLQRVPGTGGLNAVACASSRWCAAVNSPFGYRSPGPPAIDLYTSPGTGALGQRASRTGAVR